MLVLHNQLLPRLIDHRLSYVVHACKVLVEESEVVADHWLVRGLNLFSQELFNVEAVKERVGQDFLNVSLGPKSLCLVLLEKSLDKVLGNRRNLETETRLVWESHRALLNEVLHPMVVAMEERSNTDQQLKEQDTECPPIDCVVMPASDDHLWGKVFRSPTERV